GTKAAKKSAEPFNAANSDTPESATQVKVAISARILRGRNEAIRVCKLRIRDLYSANTTLPFSGTREKLISILSPLATARVTVAKQGNRRAPRRVPVLEFSGRNYASEGGGRSKRGARIGARGTVRVSKRGAPTPGAGGGASHA